MGRRRKYYGYSGIDFEGFIRLIIVCLVLSVLKLVYDFIAENYKLIILVLFVLLILIILVYLITNRKNILTWFSEKKDMRIIKKLKKYSLLYSNIEKLNGEYDFEPLEPFYGVYNVYRKSDLANLNIDDYLLMTIDSHNDKLARYKALCGELYHKYCEYEYKYNQLKDYITDEEANKLKIKKEKYDECQDKLFKMNKFVNPSNFSVVIYVNYSSAKGRVKEKRYKKYNYTEYSNFLKEYTDLKEQNNLWQISSRVERAKMSESLRYDILKRDGFKCKICGASQKDGAKLQVDHIIPVSKGGKTEPSNLQTLCSRCNIGKSNKMD